MRETLISNEEMKQLNEKKSILHHHSKFEFLNNHYGIRPGYLHGMIGTTGTGKTTLFQSIIADTLKTSKALVYLSEEEISDYQAGIQTNLADEKYLDNLTFHHETANPSDKLRNTSDLADWLETLIDLHEPDVVFIDNLSTSAFFSEDLSVSQQGSMIKKIFQLCKKTNVAIFYLAHTNSKIRDNHRELITPEDIRGSRQAVIRSEFFYVLQKFTSNGTIYVTLRTCKDRLHGTIGNFYLLGYNKRVYEFDKHIEFEVVKKIFKSRDKLQ